jgi:hypothetical protein
MYGYILSHLFVGVEVCRREGGFEWRMLRDMLRQDAFGVALNQHQVQMLQTRTTVAPIILTAARQHHTKIALAPPLKVLSPLFANVFQHTRTQLTTIFTSFPVAVPAVESNGFAHRTRTKILTKSLPLETGRDAVNQSISQSCK